MAEEPIDTVLVRVLEQESSDFSQGAVHKSQKYVNKYKIHLQVENTNNE